MKIRTSTQLQDKLDEELSWRKKEMVDYKFIVEKNKNSTRVAPLIRGGIALSYAHWEGFVKIASSMFVNYLSMKKIPMNKLKSNFIALSYLRTINQGRNIQECIALIEEILYQPKKICKIFDKDIIETKSNLKYHVLENILISLGFDKGHFKENKNFIDKKLVDPRNDIAHGTYRDLSYEDYKTVHDNVVPLMDHFNALIMNSISLKSYLL